jgi:integrase
MAKPVGITQRGKKSWRFHYTDKDGIRHFETIKGTLEEAIDRRNVCIGEISKGIPVSSKPNTVLFEELALDLLTDYELNANSTYSDQEARLRLHILPAFGKRKVAQITSGMLKRYAVQRKQEGAKVATVNRELELMRHAFKLGMQETPPKVVFLPKFPIAKERNTRQGFFEREQLEAVLRHLPAHLQPVAIFGYFTGWRHEEVTTLCWRHVHFEAGEIRLEAHESKTENPRTFPMFEDLRALLENLKPKRCFPKDLVFTREIPDPQTGQRKRGPIIRFDKAWTSACKAAGLPVRMVPKMKRVNPDDRSKGKVPALYRRGKKKGQPMFVARAAVYFHDFRRTAYRNLVRLGIPEKIAMEAVGWTDRKTADRYNVTAAVDLDLIRQAFDGRVPKLVPTSGKTGSSNAGSQ